VRFPTGGEAVLSDKSESLLARTGQNPVPTVFAKNSHKVRMAKLRFKKRMLRAKFVRSIYFLRNFLFLRNCSHYFQKEGVLL